jgi:hypothetical protein
MAFAQTGHCTEVFSSNEIHALADALLALAKESGSGGRTLAD